MVGAAQETIEETILRMVRQRHKSLTAKKSSKRKGNGLQQAENTREVQQAHVLPKTSALLRRAAAEGAVLLENRGVLPLNGKFALLGRTQIDTFCTGYGSGGDVVRPYSVNILEGLQRAGAQLVEPLVSFYGTFVKTHPADHGSWGNWPYSFPEAELPADLLAASASETDTAVVVLGRAAGEDRENVLQKGSFYLTDAEHALLQAATAHFAHVAVVLNVGNIIDFSWVEEYPIEALLLVWQGGMEAGNAVSDLLLGRISPCGKLTDTIARRYESYPSAANFGNAAYNDYAEGIFVGYRHFETRAKDDVIYPFGYGLSYSDFRISAEYKENLVYYAVVNEGAYAGKATVEVFVKKPNGAIENPARELIGFHKTKSLSPGEREEGTIAPALREFASFDEEQNAFVLPVGKYEIYVGSDVRSADMVASFSVEEPCVVERCSSILRGPLKEKILSALPSELPQSECKGKLFDVKTGKLSIEEFVASLSDAELEALSRGDFTMDSPLGAKGNAGVMGGVLPALQERGVPAVTMTDGPSGIRLRTPCSLIPMGTLLACTFDEELISSVYRLLGEEMGERGSHVLLAPGMNLHRNPLCGRNFEYFSEDPFLTGKIAAAAVRGIQETGASACPKHFCCNNQEFNRNRNDSRVGERALRELYLRGFEICVKEADPRFLMTSYNKINGEWAHYHYRLVRGVLRGEWSFKGCVITDWWMQPSKSPDFKNIKNNSYRVRAGVNVLMPGGGYGEEGLQGGSLLAELGKDEGLTRGELQKNAVEVLSVILHTSAM